VADSEVQVLAPKEEQKNVTDNSLIYAPFNSSDSEYDEDHPTKFQWPDFVLGSLQPKKSKIIKFSKKCRDLNREYELNNNEHLDNGVFNEFVNEQQREVEQRELEKQNNPKRSAVDLRDDEEMNDVAELSSDEENALRSIRLEKQSELDNSEYIGENGELQIHESI